MIEQITVFLENDKGRLAALARCLGDAGVNMSALSIADTRDYGLVRIICNDSTAAQAALEAGGYRSLVTRVLAVGVPNEPGGLASLLEALDALDVNVEYGYCFSHQDGRAVMALKIEDPGRAVAASAQIAAAGFAVLEQGELD